MALTSSRPTKVPQPSSSVGSVRVDFCGGRTSYKLGPVVSLILTFLFPAASATTLRLSEASAPTAAYSGQREI
jgi:hypothetical protein